MKAKTLPEEMEAQLTAVHGKPRDRVIDPAVEALTKTLNNVSSRVHETQQQGSPAVDTELTDLLANLDIIPGEGANGAAKRAAEVWATVEDQDDVVEALRLDAVDRMTAQLAGTLIEDDKDDEDEDGDESTGRGERAPPAYVELSSHFGVLEKAAALSGNGEAALFLAKARMAMIAAHAAKPARQADLREFVGRA